MALLAGERWRSSLLLAALCLSLGSLIRAQEPKKANERPAETAASPEPFDRATAGEMSSQCVTLETEAGNISIEFFPEPAPESVRNFLNLAATGLLDGTTFSRIVKGFVVQGGNLSTSPNWSFPMLRRASRRVPDEPSAIKHERGIVSLARSDEPNSASTHFFILVADAPHLNGKFAAFGRVTRGMEVVDQLNAAELNGEKPLKPVRIIRAIVAPCEKKNTDARPQD